MKTNANHALTVAIALSMGATSLVHGIEWYEHASVTATEDADYLKAVKEWHSDEYLRAKGPINLKYYVDSKMVDALPDRIKKLKIGMSEGDVQNHLSDGFLYAWGFNTASHGMVQIPERTKPQEITFQYKLTEINQERSAQRSRFDLLIHWKCNYDKDGFKLTYLDARLIQPRKG
ncbi:MAG: hypothetical protein ABIS50_04165 [Luteolibacter sp.]|uniref:hypothetical protein n=1 Tax=Luteolibacter sp. TaxID=1962973 RepID=UPI0032631155